MVAAAVVFGALDLVVGTQNLEQRRKNTGRGHHALCGMWWIVELGIQNAHLLMLMGWAKARLCASFLV